MSRPSKPHSSALARLGVPPEPGSVYELALTHRSFASEGPDPTLHNERLELLGDAVLGIVVTDLIYNLYQELAEGEMAQLRASVVNTQALAELARELGLGTHIRLGKGELASGGGDKPSLLANTFEAVVGAAFLDRGLDELHSVIAPLFVTRTAQVMASGGGHNAKNVLQEAVVRTRGRRPLYRVASTGPDHDKRFTADVYVDDEIAGSGSGRSKKEAEIEAAGRALAILEQGSQPLVGRHSVEEVKADARAS